MNYRALVLNVLEYLPFPIAGISVLGVLIVLGNAIWYVIGGPPSSSNAPEFSPEQNTQNRTIDVDVIARANLFGVANDSAPRDEVIQNTNLRLQLHGTLVSENANDSIALISTQSQRNPEKYQVDEAVGGIARIEEIHSSRVILSRGGKREQLLYQNAEAQITHLVTGSIQANSVNPIGPDLTNQVSEAQIQKLIQEFGFKSDFAEIQELAAKLDEHTLGSQYGLQKGDKVVSVNGIPSERLAESEAELMDILQSTDLTFEIQRDRRRFSISIPVEY